MLHNWAFLQYRLWQTHEHWCVVERHLCVTVVGRHNRTHRRIVNDTLLPCSSDGPDTRRQSRVFHTPVTTCIRRRRLCASVARVWRYRNLFITITITIITNSFECMARSRHTISDTTEMLVLHSFDCTSAFVDMRLAHALVVISSAVILVFWLTYSLYGFSSSMPKHIHI